MRELAYEIRQTGERVFCSKGGKCSVNFACLAGKKLFLRVLRCMAGTEIYGRIRS
jgi:hypothetical protein